MRSQKLFKTVSLLLRIGFLCAILFILLVTALFIRDSLGPEKDLLTLRTNGLSLSSNVKLFNGGLPWRSADTAHFSVDHTSYLQEAALPTYQLNTRYKSPLGKLILCCAICEAAAFVYGLWLLRLIFRDVSEDQPFPKRLAQRMRTIALLFIGVDLLRILYYFLFRYLCAGIFPEAPRLVVSPELEIGGGIIVGLLLLCLSVVFRRGEEIYAEQQLTV